MTSLRRLDLSYQIRTLSEVNGMRSPSVGLSIVGRFLLWLSRLGSVDERRLQLAVIPIRTSRRRP